MRLAGLGILLALMAFTPQVVFAQNDSADDEPSFEEAAEPQAAVEDGSQSAEGSDSAEGSQSAEGSRSAEGSDPAPAESTAADPPAQPQVNPDATFTPTEEISEDKPVAFPVDI